MNMDKDKTRLVEDNLHVVKAVLKKEIKMNDSDVDLEFNELYQIGCLALCKASITFDETKNTDFFTYAYKLVKNSLLDHCRRVQRKQKYIVDGGDDMPEGVYDGYDESLEETQFWRAFSSITKYAKSKYTGVVLKGIEAIEFKALGYNGREIADLYGVKVNHVNAWISKARSKLRDDPVVMSYIKK